MIAIFTQIFAFNYSRRREKTFKTTTKNHFYKNPLPPIFYFRFYMKMFPPIFGEIFTQILITFVGLKHYFAVNNSKTHIERERERVVFEFVFAIGKCEPYLTVQESVKRF